PAPASAPSAGVITGRGPRGFSLGGPLLPLFVLCGIALVQEMDRDAIGVLTPEIRDYFGLDLTTLTVIVSLTGVLTLLLALPVGYLSDRLRRTWLTTGCVLAIGVCGLLSGLLPTILLFTIARAARGIGRTLEPAPHAAPGADFPPAVGAEG